MQRRTLLRLGIAGAGALGLAGSAGWLWRPAWDAGQLTKEGRQLFHAVADAVLDGLLPEAADQRLLSLNQWEMDFVATVGNLPEGMQREVHQLSALLLSPPGRRWLADLPADWPSATRQQVTDALQSMRSARSALRQQSYHAMRDLCNAAYFANPQRWAMIGYGGQLAIGAAS